MFSQLFIKRPIFAAVFLAKPAPIRPAPAAAAPAQDELYTKLQQLGDLRQQGILTDDEFAAQKAKLLNG